MELYEIKRIIKRKGKVFFDIVKKIYKPIRIIKERPLRQKQYKYFLKQIESINKTEGKVIYVGIPIHANLGDQAQYYCIKEWLEKNYNERKVIEISDCIINSNYKDTKSKLLEIVNENDYIIFQSGYRTTDIANIIGEYTHRMIVEMFPNNKTLVFPQTVNFKNEDEKKKSKEAYLKGNKILFLARDEKSYKMAKQLYPKVTLELYPDIVTSLIGKYKYRNSREGILCCTRRDGEKLYENNDIQIMIDNLKKITKVDRNDTTISINQLKLNNNLKNILEETFEEFSKYKVIITDRYHGTIFGLISATPTIVLSSTDHKLSSGVNWFKEEKSFDKYVYYAKSLEEAEEIAKKIYDDNSYIYEVVPYFEKNYYNKLKEKFEKV